MKKGIIRLSFLFVLTLCFVEGTTAQIGVEKISFSSGVVSPAQDILQILSTNRDNFTAGNLNAIAVPNGIFNDIDQSGYSAAEKTYFKALFYFYRAMGQNGKAGDWDHCRQSMNDLLELPLTFSNSIDYFKGIVDFLLYKNVNDTQWLDSARTQLAALNVGQLGNLRPSVLIFRSLVNLESCERNIIPLADQVNDCNQIIGSLSDYANNGGYSNLVKHLLIRTYYRKVILDQQIADKGTDFSGLNGVTSSIPMPPGSFLENSPNNMYRIDLLKYSYGKTPIPSLTNDSFLGNYRAILENILNSNYNLVFPTINDPNPQIQLWGDIFRLLNIYQGNIVLDPPINVLNTLNALDPQFQQLDFTGDEAPLNWVRDFFTADIDFMRQFLNSMGATLNYAIPKGVNQLPEGLRTIARSRQLLCRLWNHPSTADAQLLDFHSNSPLIYLFYLARISGSKRWGATSTYYQRIIQVTSHLSVLAGIDNLQRAELTLLKYSAGLKLYDLTGDGLPASLANWQNDLQTVIAMGDANLSAQAHYSRALYYDRLGDNQAESEEINQINNYELLGGLVDSLEEYTDDPQSYQWHGFMVNHLDDPYTLVRGYPQEYSGKSRNAHLKGVSSPGFSYRSALLDMFRNFPIDEKFLSVFPLPLLKSNGWIFSVLDDGVSLHRPVNIIVRSNESLSDATVEMRPSAAVHVSHDGNTIHLSNIQWNQPYTITIAKRGFFPWIKRKRFIISQTLTISLKQAKRPQYDSTWQPKIQAKRKYIIALDVKDDKIAYILSADGKKYIGVISLHGSSLKGEIAPVEMQGYDPVVIKWIAADSLIFYDNMQNKIFRMDVKGSDISSLLNLNKISLHPQAILLDENGVNMVNEDSTLIKINFRNGNLPKPGKKVEGSSLILREIENGDTHYYREFVGGSASANLVFQNNRFVSDFWPTPGDLIFALDALHNKLLVEDLDAGREIAEFSLDNSNFPLCLYKEGNKLFIGGENKINSYNLENNPDFSYQP